MNLPDQGVKAGVDAYVVFTGVAAFIGDMLHPLALLVAIILSVIRIINEWPQLRKTVKGWFKAKR